jgi:hypothetical protein
MPDQKISELSILSSLAANDYVNFLDFSDTTFGPSGTNKKVFLSTISSFITGGLSSIFYPRTSNPSGYLVSNDLSTYATQTYVNAISGVLRTDLTTISSWTGSTTGLYYPRNSNPSGFVTSNQTGALTGQFPSYTDIISSSGGYLSDSGKLAEFDKYGELNIGAVPLSDFGNSIDRRIFGQTPSTGNKLIFSVQNHAGSSYERNTGCWAYGIDLTPISVWNSDGANEKGGILISPRHILFANHFSITTGSTVRFVTRDNTVVNRTLSNSAQIGSTDLRIGLLDSDVPQTISFAKVLPKAFASYYSLSGAPVLYTDNAENALVAELEAPSTGTIIDFYVGNSRRSGFYESPTVGDSGGPMCLVYGNQLVALTSLETNQYGPSLHYYYDAVNSGMSSLGGSYQLSNIEHFPLTYNSLIDRPALSNAAFITAAFLPTSGQIPLVNASGVLDPSVIPTGLNFTGGLTNVVFTTGAQTISGLKTFVNGINMSNSTLDMGGGIIQGIDYSIDIANGSLLDDAFNERVNWQNGTLSDAGGVVRIDWSFLQLSGNWQTNTTATLSTHLINKGYFDINTGLLTGRFYPLASNPSGYVRSTSGTVTVEGGATILNGQLLIGSSGDNGFLQGNLNGTSGVVITSGSGSLGVGLNYTTVVSNLTGTFITGVVAGTNITVTNNGNSTWTINSTASGSANTGQLTGAFYPLTGNPSGFVQSVSGSIVVPDVEQIYNGQLLIGSSGDNAFIQGGITASTGISITSGSGSLVMAVNTNGLTGVFQPLPSYRLITGTTDTLLSSDNTHSVLTTNGSAVTITVPSGFISNYSVQIIQGGAGQVTVVTGAGTTLNSYSGFDSIIGQYATASLLATGLNKFLLYGSLI